MKNDYTSNSHYLTYTFFSLEGWENELFELGSERANVPLWILLCRLTAIPLLVSDFFHISLFPSSFCAPSPDQLSLLYRAGAENNRKSSTSTSHASCSSICCRWAKSSWTSTMSSSRTRQATPGLYHNRAAHSPFFLQSCWFWGAPQVYFRSLHADTTEIRFWRHFPWSAFVAMTM